VLGAQTLEPWKGRVGSEVLPGDRDRLVVELRASSPRRRRAGLAEDAIQDGLPLFLGCEQRAKLLECPGLVRFQRQGFAKVGNRFIRSIEALAEQLGASQELARARGRRLGPRDLRVQQVEKDFSTRWIGGLLLQGFGNLECLVEGFALIGVDLQGALKVREGFVSALADFAEQLREFDANGDLVAAREV